MDTIRVRYDVMVNAVNSFGEAVDYFYEIKSDLSKVPSAKNEIVYRAARDSLIQRFEFSIELFWKYLRRYLEEVEEMKLAFNTPREAIREACKARLVSEDDAALLLTMIQNRNLTSHIYKEDIAEQLAHDIPGYYDQLKRLVLEIKAE